MVPRSKPMIKPRNQFKPLQRRTSSLSIEKSGSPTSIAMRRSGLSARKVRGIPTRLLLARTVISQRMKDQRTLIASELMSMRAFTSIRFGSTGFISTLRISMKTLQSRRPAPSQIRAPLLLVGGTLKPIVEMGSPFRIQRPPAHCALLGQGVSPSGQVMPTKLPKIGLMLDSMKSSPEPVRRT